MAGLKPSESTQQSTSSAEPWGPQQDYLKNIMSRAEQLYQQPTQNYYPGTTVAPNAPETNQAWDAQSARATGGSPVTDSAQNENLKTTNGDYLAQGNPYLDALYKRSAAPVEKSFRDAVAPSIAGRFLKAGRWGSGAMTDELGNATDSLGRTLGDLSASIYAPAYEAERGRMQSAVNSSIPLANQDYTDIGQLGAVGSAKQDQGQAQINEAKNRYDYNGSAEGNKLAQFLQFIQGNYGGTTTAEQPVYTNNGANALSGGLTGAYLGQLLGVNPWLSTIGGGLLGMA